MGDLLSHDVFARQDADLTPADTLAVRISHTIRSDLAAKDLGAKLLRHAPKPIGAQGFLYALSEKEVEALLEHADAAWTNSERGVRKAYLSLRIQLRDVLRAFRTRGLTPDPGISAFHLELMGIKPPCSIACFAAGDKAISRSGEEVTILEGFKLFKVRASDGPYYDEDGDRVTYKFGYFVRMSHGDFFASAHELYDVDENLKYMRLATVDGRRL